MVESADEGGYLYAMTSGMGLPEQVLATLR